MKNKLFTCICLTAIIVFVSFASLFAQAKSTFAGDININPATGAEYGHARVSVAYNGDVYVGRLVRYSGTEYTAYEILKSTDGGHTFTDITGIIATPSDVHYIAFDMIACGNNDANFRLFFAVSRMKTTNSEARIGFAWFNSAGIIGATVPESPTFTYTGNRGWESIALSSDTKDPAMMSTPYSVSIAAIKAGSFDSVIVWTGNDGGTTFTRRALASTSRYFRNISCATGTTNNNNYGKLGIVWDEMFDNSAQYGNVKAHFIFADDATDFGSSGPYDVGVVDDVYRRPVIAMANNNAGTDINGTIAYESDASLANFGVNIYCRQFDQLNNGAPQVTIAQNGRLVADGAGDQVNPHVSYNPADDKFLYTYYNGANDALVYKTVDYGTNIATDPVLAHANYRDAQSAITDPFPRVDGLTSSRNYFVWTDQFNTYIDNETNWPASVQNTSVSISEMKLYPNPATDNITLNFTAEEKDNVTLIIIDISGKTIQSRQADIIQGNNKIPVALNSISAGNYIIRIAGNHSNSSMMFTVTQ